MNSVNKFFFSVFYFKTDMDLTDYTQIKLSLQEHFIAFQTC